MRVYSKALITGASRGLGAALARALASKGYHLALCARSEGELRSLASEIRASATVDIDVIVADLSNIENVNALCASLARGANGIDVLINNAGIGAYKPITECTNEEIAACVNVNVTAPMLLAKAILPQMIAAKRGMIVNIGSDLSRRYLAKMVPYVASKHALLGFSGSLLREVKPHGIKVSAVLPGIIDTAFNGAQEGSKEETWALRPAELANRIVDLIELPENVVIDELTIHPLHQDF